MVRLLSYNVHRCVGTDRRLDVGRIAAVIAAEEPDIVCLQEVDVGRARTGRVDQAQALARRLGMAPRFHAAMRVEAEEYGDAVLTALPERLVKAGPLPGDPRAPFLEPRGALWVAIQLGERRLDVVTTHLGLTPREQQAQAEDLLGPRWLGGREASHPLILAGDFNITRLARSYRRLAAALRDARHAAPAERPTPTFPSRLPVLAIDHVFLAGKIEIEAVRTAADPLSRMASDHLPLIVDFSLG